MIALLLACSPAPAPSLVLPIDCVLGEDCWLPKRPDVVPGPGFRDHAGHDHTDEGHSGTDVAVRDASQALATWVVAPVSGIVVGTRDDEPDGQLLADGVDAVGEVECGNGVGLDPGGGWFLQVCHLHRGTLVVSVGDRVTTGDPLGRVGWSGEAEYPHVHLTVRFAGRVVDPFTGRFLDDGTIASPLPLWAQPLPAPGEIDALAWAGFDAGPDDDESSPIDGGRGVVPSSASSLLLRVFLWRPEAGDRVRTEIRTPDGTTTRSTTEQPRDRPRQVWTIEKTWPPEQRPVGLWTAHVVWSRGERTRDVWTSTVLR